MEESKTAEKIKNWLKNPYNLGLVGILIASFFIRLYYHTVTQGQTLWWDEAEYMATANKWAFDAPYTLNPQRPPLFQLLAALAFMAGLGEGFVKFSFVLLPSLALLAAIYFLGREMFNEKVGLIAAVLAAVNWSLLFWTARMQPDSFSVLFQVLSILFIWKYWKNPKVNLIVYAGIFAALGFYFKVSALLVPMSFAVFMLVKDRLEAFKNKDYYYFALSFLATLIPYFIWSKISFGTFTAFKAGYSDAVGTPVPFGWYNIKFFYILTENISFVLFIIGLIIALKFLLYIDVLIKDKKRCFDPELFSIITILLVSAFYIFYIRGTEDRWVFLWLPFIFFFMANAMILISGYFGKSNNKVALSVIVGILLVISYLHVGHAHTAINQRVGSYAPVKDAGIWIKENSQNGDVVLTQSQTQMAYYSQRQIRQFYNNESETFDQYINQSRPRFLTWSMFEHHPEWVIPWIQKNNGRLRPVHVIFADQARQQPAIVVYEIRYE